MASENQILTALGLDVSQFEEGAAKGTRATKALLGAIASVDIELRKIPLLGDIYSATFGKIADGYSQTALEAREFSRIMSTDVGGSLDGALQQIDDLNSHLHELKTGSFSRTISDLVSNLGNFAKVTGGAAGGFFSNLIPDKIKSGAKNLGKDYSDNFKAGVDAAGALVPDSIKDIVDNAKEGAGQFDQAQIERDKKIAAAEKRKQDVIKITSDLLQRQAVAHSDITKGSEEEAELDRIRIGADQKIFEAEQRAFKQGGPERDKWEKSIVDRLEKETSLYNIIANNEQKAASKKYQFRRADLDASKKIAELQYSGNERDIAAEELRLAKEKEVLSRTKGTAEEQARAQAAVSEAEQRNLLTKHNYDLAVEQLGIETKLMDLRVRGQTRAAVQTEIQLHFQQRINEETRRGNVELAKELNAQQKLAKLQEAIRQYELGGRGRAAERRQERHAARTARVVQSRLNERELDQRVGNQFGGGLTSNGLRSGGLTSGSLARPKQFTPQQKQIPPSAVEQFMKTVVDALTK